MIVKYGETCYEYEEEKLDINELPPITHDNAKEILFKTQDVLSKLGINIYLSFGTLLGAVRDKDFIKGDLDVDVYVKNEKALFDNLEKIKEDGLILIRARKHKVYSFRYHNKPGCYIDIYICRKTFSIWGVYCFQLLGKMVPKQYLQDGEIEFLGRNFRCPRNPEKILEFWYYDTWSIPIAKSDRKYTYDVSSHYYYMIFYKWMKKIVKSLLLKKEDNKCR